jgi:hypothetical protein
MSDAMLEIKMRWAAKYGRLEADERAALIKQECEAGRERLRAAGIGLTMPSHELEALLGNDD